MPLYMAQSAGNACDTVRSNQTSLNKLKGIIYITDATKRRQRIVLQFLAVENVSGGKIYRRIQNLHLKMWLSRRLVFLLCRDFRS